MKESIEELEALNDDFSNKQANKDNEIQSEFDWEREKLNEIMKELKWENENLNSQVNQLMDSLNLIQIQ